MASSSTSTSTSHTVNNNDYVFDVFINHRGPDVKKTLATDLYHRLCKHDLRVFLDEQELRVGENLTPQIESAIRTSSVNIAIFSPNYAYSTWCLDELVLMVECMSKYKSTIIPVFYGVKPTELRWVEGGKGVYAQALRELQEKKDVEGGPRYDSNTLKKWKKALSDVPEIIGFDGEKYNRKIKPKPLSLPLVNIVASKNVKLSLHHWSMCTYDKYIVGGKILRYLGGGIIVGGKIRRYLGRGIIKNLFNYLKIAHNLD